MKAKTLLLAACLLSARLIVPSLYAQNFTFSTIAGGSPGLLDGLNTNAEFLNDTGAAVDAAGNIYVADQGNNVIRKITPSGTNWIVTTIAGGASGSLDGSNSAAQFYGPAGIAAGSSGKLYVTDQYNSTIRQMVLAGTNWVVSTIAGSAGLAGSLDGTNAGSRFSDPAGIAVDASGNIFVADEVNNTIRKITPSGTNWIVTTIAGGTRGASDGTNNAAQFSGPSGVAVDSGGRVFVSDQFNNTIRLITPSGANWIVSTIAGQSISGRADGTGTNSHFNSPINVAVDSSGNAYVADLFNSAIRKITAVGSTWVVTTIAGGSPGAADGTGTNAQFGLPFGVATDAFGDVFVADSQNNAVRLGIAAGSPPATGGLQVVLTPPNNGGGWQLDGGTLQTSGTTLSGLPPGNHTVTFANVSGSTTPAAQNVIVTARQTTSTTANYAPAVANAGSLQVLLSPAGAVNAGAQWQVDGGAFQTNGAIIAGLSSLVSHTVSFGYLAGYNPPPNQTITLTNARTTLVQGNYVLQAGSLEVTLLPTAVVTAGAKWQVDGGSFKSSGTTLSGLLPGNHTISFNTVLGWKAPSSQVVTIADSVTSTVTAAYFNLNGPAPLLTAPMVAGGKFQFSLLGPAGSNYIIQASSNLVIWSPILTNTVPAGGSLPVTDSGATNQTLRFYRAIMPGN